MADDNKFIKGYNDGYLLNQHDPQFLKLILAGPNGASEYVQGLQEGSKQFEKEKLIEHFKVKNNTDKSRDREKDD